MARDTQHEAPPDPRDVGEAAAEEPQREDAAAPTPDEGAAESDEPDVRLQQAQALAEARNQQFLRLSADFDNFRRRVERDREELRASVARELLVGLLPAYDNLERALRAMPAEVEPGLKKGLEMTRKSFVDGLAAQGVERVATTGHPFDPVIHEAIQSVPASEPEGTVLDEFQAGFRWRGRVLRAALVKVSAGGGEEPSGGDVPEAGG